MEIIRQTVFSGLIIAPCLFLQIEIHSKLLVICLLVEILREERVWLFMYEKSNKVNKNILCKFEIDNIIKIDNNKQNFKK